MIAPEIDREAWLAERRKGIGATDVAAILGQSPYRTARHVYEEKVNGLTFGEPTEEMEIGLLMEPVIAELYQRRTGLRLSKAVLQRSSELPFLFATPDWLVLGDRVVEGKNTHGYRDEHWGEAGTDHIPDQYIIQTQVQMLVTGFERADVARLRGGNRFDIFVVHRSNAILDVIRHAATEFWDRVERRIPPEPDYGHARTGQLLEALYAPTNGKVVTLGHDAAFDAREYERLGEEIKEAEEQRKAAKNRLVTLMQDAECGSLPDGRYVSRKEICRKAYSVAETKYTDFRIKKPKGVPA